MHVRSICDCHDPDVLTSFSSHFEVLSAPMPQSLLGVNDLTLAVHLGYSAEERLRTQEIRISFQIASSILPDACTSDSLSITASYQDLVEGIKNALALEKEFKTVEKIAHICFTQLKRDLRKEDFLRLSVHKVNPPIEFLKGGVMFEISDDGFRR